MKDIDELAHTVRLFSEYEVEASKALVDLTAYAKLLQEQRRRLLILADYGFGMEFFAKHADDADFLTVEWLERWYNEPLPEYIEAELEEGGTCPLSH